MSANAHKKNSVFEVFDIDAREFVFISDEIGALGIYNDTGTLLETFIHLEVTRFGNDYPKGKYKLKFAFEGGTIEEIVFK